MKTTNYELSKKLADIGFLNIDNVFGYNKSGSWLHDAITEDKYIAYPSYDLETLLGYFPRRIIEVTYHNGDKKYFTDFDGGDQDVFDKKEYIFQMDFYMIGYTLGDKIIFSESLHFRAMAHEPRSIADAAAKLLILLHDICLVEFGGENE